MLNGCVCLYILYKFRINKFSRKVYVWKMCFLSIYIYICKYGKVYVYKENLWVKIFFCIIFFVYIYIDKVVFFVVEILF